jgi:hypothetical protein
VTDDGRQLTIYETYGFVSNMLAGLMLRCGLPDVQFSLDELAEAQRELDIHQRPDGSIVVRLKPGRDAAGAA